MNIIRKSLLVLALVLITPIIASAACNTLIVSLTDADWQINPKLPGCEHGAVNSTTTDQAVMGNIGSFGPDCQVSFINTQTSDTATVAFQQNYCVLEAGSISVTPISGAKPIYTSREGSYADGTPGKVTITGFSGTTDRETSAKKEQDGEIAAGAE